MAVWLIGCCVFGHQAVNETNTPLPDTVLEIMNRWVLQMGFPVVTINTATGQLSQQHFLLDPNSTVDRPSQYKYVWACQGQFSAVGYAVHISEVQFPRDGNGDHGFVVLAVMEITHFLS